MRVDGSLAASCVETGVRPAGYVNSTEPDHAPEPSRSFVAFNLASSERNPGAAASLGLVPEPAEVKLSAGQPFVLTKRTRVVLEGNDPNLAASGKYLAELLRRSTGFPIGLVGPGKTTRLGDIVLQTGADPADTDSLGDEGYAFTVTATGIVIRAKAARGVFYGIQTVRELFPPTVESRALVAGYVCSAPAIEIVDRPRFRWRGLLLDVSRHFFAKADVERLLDLMALHKLNTFHWHLTDNPGWRIAIRRWPKLTEVGAWRAQSSLEDNLARGDGTPYGGYYSQADIREIVRYAATRFIDVIPEIELPGHSSAAICAYPQFGCSDVVGYAPYVESLFGWNPYVLAPSDSSLAFLEAVLDEVVGLFPGRFVHLGGEEVVAHQWYESQSIRALMRAKGLSDARAVESYMMRRLQQFLSAHNRRLVGWDGIQDGGLPADAVMMCWRDEPRARAAILAGYDVVMAPTHLYLDRYQGAPSDEPPAIGGYEPLDSVYACDVMPAGLDADLQTHVLGAEGLIWTECIKDRAKLEYMAFPRVCALSEIVWSPNAVRDWNSFRSRLGRHLTRLSALGVHYRFLD